MNDSMISVRVIALLIGIAVVSFLVRAADMSTDLNAFKVLTEHTRDESQVLAQNDNQDDLFFDLPSIEPAAGNSKAEKVEEPVEEHTEATEEEASEEEAVLSEEEQLANLPEWRDPGDTDPMSMSVKQEVFDELYQRRIELDNRERDLQAREALLKATDKELKRKYKEMETLREELEILLGRQSEEEKARISSLVKVYENMKPKDAARIFDTLDLDILLNVTAEMSERKLSPILAAMNAERARTVTIMLAEQRKLPEPKGNI